jgi:K(+)-stimulated pyrophosphate-energized sodium pump
MPALGLTFLCRGLAIIYGIWSVRWILAQAEGNERMSEIATATQEGASAYLNRQYTTIAIVGVVLFLALGLSPVGRPTGIGFLIGSVLSGAAGYIGMNISVRTNLRTAEATNKGVNLALQVAFRGDAITGMLFVGLGLLGVAGYYSVLINMGYSFYHKQKTYRDSNSALRFRVLIRLFLLLADPSRSSRSLPIRI